MKKGLVVLMLLFSGAALQAADHRDIKVPVWLLNGDQLRLPSHVEVSLKDLRAGVQNLIKQQLRPHEQDFADLENLTFSVMMKGKLRVLEKTEKDAWVTDLYQKNPTKPHLRVNIRRVPDRSCIIL